MQWISDRFFLAQNRWIDAATGHAVRLHVTKTGPDSLDWDEQCARLANLRHPLLNALIDYGPLGQAQRFEAFDDGGALAVAGAGGAAGLEHVTQFLRSAGVALNAGRCSCAIRAVTSGRGALTRPVGVTLQTRRVLAAVEEALDDMAPAGPGIVPVHGADAAGLRTLRVLVARSARLRGFVPLDAAVVARYPALVAALHDRHVCLLDVVEAPARSAAGVARLIATLAAASARRHVVIRFERRRGSGAAGVVLDPLALRSLVGMVFATDEGPTEDELFTAARHADGLPGLFLSRLSGEYPQPSRSMVVHETASHYVVSPVPECAPAVLGGRVLGSALRASSRAAALVRQGRHATAVRVLTRGMRVLGGRDRPREAAGCALQLGWLALERGDPAAAKRHFEAARELAGDSVRAVLASVGAGVALTDDNRLLEAEAVLRGALAAADTFGDAEAQALAATALARCLYWQGRWTDGIAVAVAAPSSAVAPPLGARLAAIHARCLARAGRSAAAVQQARAGQALAGAADDAAVTATAELALAEVLITAGDATGARASLNRAVRLARAAHLPLVRVRAVLLQAASNDAVAKRLAHRLVRLRLPPLLAGRLKTAAAAPALSARSVGTVAELETLLNVAQKASDDGAALAEVCAATRARVRGASIVIVTSDDRLLCLDGRPWPTAHASVRQVFASSAALAPHREIEPREAAEPVRFGGEVVAALACRWTAGTRIDTEGAVVLLRAAALAVAPHVRAILDRRLPEPPAAWADLLGESAPAVALRESVLRAARAPFPVLVEGESGCGKELVARALHRLGPRRDRRFCALNCAALTDELVEAELFGHTRGAFTGAAAERAGLFEEADGGTLFLDEIGELSARAQAKLLRVLQEGEVRRVGENMPRRVDVRVVAATNRRLADEAAAGRFRADLRFRLDVVRISVPPLRERASDVPLLATHFWRDAAARVGSQATLSPEALAALSRYDWPGNVRELQNVIAWMAVQSPRRGRIGPSALPAHVAQAAPPVARTFEAAREEFERRFIRAALAGANGQRARAAEAIGVTRQGLSKMMRRLRMDVP